MNIQQIEENVKRLSEEIIEETFIYDFLLSYGIPRASVTRLQRGDYNSSDKPNEVLWKRKIFFCVEKNENLLSKIDDLKREERILKHRPLYIIVTDFKNLLAVDLKAGDTLDIPIEKVSKYFDFFLPLIGLAKTKLQIENPADVKAAEKLGKLYDLIVQDNPPSSDSEYHALNIFLSRLLFCFFAEDTEIFDDGLFTNSLASHTKEDGTDLQNYLRRLFKVLNTEQQKDIPNYLERFPYVNGGLFDEDIQVPVLSSKARKIIIECGTLNWASINPDIFGSMIQAVVHHGKRGELGIHYTSVVNIMRVIEPLFLNELKEQLESAGSNKKKLNNLLSRLYKIKVFDPACGSGNFLIIALKELCRLEIEIFKRLYDKQTAFRLEGGISLSQFYGIEIDDFAHETAKLSLWLAEHQMNLEFKEVFGHTKPTLPLKAGGNIYHGNATTLDWHQICPTASEDEVYVLGNPPYLGASLQKKEHKKDIKNVFEKVFGETSAPKKVDYISCWFFIASRYINQTSKFAFVTTNSICQGEQVPIVWSRILDELEIGFARKSFLWTNNAKRKAGVTCSIIGLRHPSRDSKYIFEESQVRKVSNINAYLVEGNNIFVQRTKKMLSPLPEMLKGNMPIDGGYYMLSVEEKNRLLEKDPELAMFFKKIVGTKEFINGIERWCIWISEDLKLAAYKNAEISARIGKVKELREAGGSQAQGVSHRPHEFYATNRAQESQIVVARVSSSRREYLPIDFLDVETIVSDGAQVIYDPDPFVFAVLCSKMHMNWIKAVSGRLKNDYRYSAGICYNSFPFPDISTEMKSVLENLVFMVIDEREKFPEKTLADLYDPDTMPKSLLNIHREIDFAIDRCYKRVGFRSDDERLQFLFNMYEKLINSKDGE